MSPPRGPAACAASCPRCAARPAVSAPALCPSCRPLPHLKVHPLASLVLLLPFHCVALLLAALGPRLAAGARAFARRLVPPLCARPGGTRALDDDDFLRRLLWRGGGLRCRGAVAAGLGHDTAGKVGNCGRQGRTRDGKCCSRPQRRRRRAARRLRRGRPRSRDHLVLR